MYSRKEGLSRGLSPPGCPGCGYSNHCGRWGANKRDAKDGAGAPLQQPRRAYLTRERTRRSGEVVKRDQTSFSLCHSPSFTPIPKSRDRFSLALVIFHLPARAHSATPCPTPPFLLPEGTLTVLAESDPLAEPQHSVRPCPLPPAYPSPRRRRHQHPTSPRPSPVALPTSDSAAEKASQTPLGA